MKKLYISVTVLIIFIFVTTTATYAWLGMAMTNTVRDINLSTYAGDELEISIDGINYYEALPSHIMMKHIENTKLTDITSNDGKDFSFGIRSKNEQPVKNIDYISYNFYFRTTSINMHQVFLANNITDKKTYEDEELSGTYIVSKGKYFMSDVDFLYGPNKILNKGETSKFHISDAMRVSFVSNTKSKIFDLSGNEERGFGKPYGQAAYYNLKKGVQELPTVIPNTNYQLSSFNLNEPFALDDTSHIVTLTHKGNFSPDDKYYYEGNITMNIWVEGWDADLFDAVFGDTIKMQFQFKSVIGLRN